ncbi:hypothetical protein BO99DRAFT_145471 [Aspergillus violaceofuscus CBS 115571]|uniref:Secreted protein n=1 Tax=Aspergillus violaceofuscus (strain CBS 115571) TaxID=1450538 RepID=A0A2V5HAF9_ASPV1|nr:hypothetical protein BO99DRAFT_145471 [Aspergillus violaceofuscus CBS 115571]
MNWVMSEFFFFFFFFWEVSPAAACLVLDHGSDAWRQARQYDLSTFLPPPLPAVKTGAGSATHIKPFIFSLATLFITVRVCLRV